MSIEIDEDRLQEQTDQDDEEDESPYTDHFAERTRAQNLYRKNCEEASKKFLKLLRLGGHSYA